MKTNDKKAPPAMEPCEARVLLSGTLLGVEPANPLLTFNNTGVISYNAATQALTMTATPLTLKLTSASAPLFVFGPSSLTLGAQVDNAGNFVAGIAGDDLVISGAADLDGDFVPDVSGVLLTAEITGFGAADSGTITDDFDMTFNITGGLLVNYYPTRKGAAVVTGENSTFAGSFEANFAAHAKGYFGAAPGNSGLPVALGDYVWKDLNANGIQDSGEAGVPNVPVTLLDGVGNVVASTSTDINGFYIFSGLSAGTYGVRFTAPSGGWGFTLPNVGSDATDSDANVATGLTPLVTLAPGQTDYTIDAGLVYRGGGQGCTPGFWKQPQHFVFWNGYDQGDSFETVFGVQATGTPTLLDALGANGGGEYALMRHATAALLNACSGQINFMYSPAEVIAMTQWAYSTGNFEQVKNLFAKQNETGYEFGSPGSKVNKAAVVATPVADGLDGLVDLLAKGNGKKK
jgi:hypothetical protein